MQAIGGLVTAGNIVLSLVIAIRLLRLGARTRGPERWLGVYFLLATSLGTILSSAVYMSWADPKLALPEGVRSALHGMSLALMSVAYLGILLFTQRVFRPLSEPARAVVWVSAALLVLSFVGVGLTERFGVRIVNGPAYWVGFLVREAAMGWMALESWHYWGQQRRRLRIGLADPILVNRFLLWGIWASTVFATMLADPGARVWYWWITGTTETWVADVGRPIIVSMIALSSLLGAISASTLLLTFFPTPGYRRWLVARHELWGRSPT